MDGFFGIGLPELFMIAVIALIVLGPERLPGTIREVAKFIRQVRAMGSDLMAQFGDEFKDLQDLDPRRIINEMTDPLKLDDKGKPIPPKPVSKPTTPTPAKNTTATTASTTPKPAVTTTSSSAAKPTTSTSTTAVANTTVVASATGAAASGTASAHTTNGTGEPSSKSVAKELAIPQPSNHEKPVENTIAPPHAKSAPKPAVSAAKPSDPTIQLVTDPATTPLEAAEAKPKAKRTRKPKAKAETVLADPLSEEQRGMTQQAPVINPIEESRMTLMEHLIELRTRSIWIVGSIILGTIIGLIYYEPILIFVTATARSYNLELQNIRPTDSISIIFKVAFTVGTSLAMPVIVFQILAFMAPGLYPNEKRNIYISLPAIVVLFLIGISFAYTILLPVAVGFLGNLLTGIIRQDWTAQDYINFVTRLVFWIGVAFEMPLIFAVLSRLGVVSAQMLIKYWRHAIVVIAIIAAIITPTVDPVNMSIVMGPLMILYGLSIFLAWLLYRPRTPRDFSEESFVPDEYKEK